MEKEQMVEQTKRMIYSRKGYGMFDWLDRLVEKDGLLSRPPRMLMAQLALVLDIPVGDIPYGALRAWLGRYRKANCIRQKKDTGRNQVPAQEKKKRPDWMDFEPTPLIEVHKEEEPLFRHVTYGDTDR